MQRLIKEFPPHHQVALLCEANVFRDILSFYGHPMTLPLCFGLSSAMGFCYGANCENEFIVPNYRAPSFIASPLMPFYLNNLARVTNVWCKGGRTKDKKKLLEIIKANINEGRPVIVEVETMSYFTLTGLPRFNMDFKQEVKFAIGGHVVQIIGYDEEKKTLIIMEAFVKSVLEVPMDEFLTCCTIDEGYFPPEGEWITFYVPSKLPPLKNMVFLSIRCIVHQMLYPFTTNSAYNFGLKAMENFFNDIVLWPKMMNPAQLQISLGLYYNFQRISPKKGSFREMYSSFLLEAFEKIGIPELKEAASKYDNLHTYWNEISDMLLISFNNPAGGIFSGNSSIRKLFDTILYREKEAVLYLSELLMQWQRIEHAPDN